LTGRKPGATPRAEHGARCNYPASAGMAWRRDLRGMDR